MAKNRRCVAIVNTAAASWFSVMEDMKRPIDTNAMPTKRSARRLPKITAVLTNAYRYKIRNDSEETSVAPAKTVYAAKNFAKTMLVKERGAVSKSCSVLCLRSSLKDFIVKSGKTTASNTRMSKKYVEGSADIE